MKTILWADDQEDVIQTLATLLTSLNVKIVQCNSGTAAIAKLKADYFDLLILDLMMPPDKWGGLWLLEEIRRAHIKIPVLILSGEGSQHETIKALRLGASDYVMKENVQVELLQRVRDLLQSQMTDLCLPSPIAVPYRKFCDARYSLAKLKALIQLYEHTLRLACFLGISEISTFSTYTGIDLGSLLEQLRAPSMGHWDQIRHHLSKYIKKRGYFSGINDCINNRVVNRVIKVRNDIAHGTEPSEKVACELVDELKMSVKLLVVKMDTNCKYNLVFTDTFEFDGRKFINYIRYVYGDSPMLQSASIQTYQPLISQRVYVVSNIPDFPVLDLFPFIHVEGAREPNLWKVLMFDACETAVKTKATSWSIRYLNIWSGERPVINTNLDSNIPLFDMFFGR